MAIITISRGTFGGGKAVAEAVAEHLNHICVSREMLVESAASTFGISVDQLRDSILKSPGPLGINAGQNIHFMKYIRATILEMGRDNNMVYHGFGGQLLLQGVPQLLRVRIIAGMEYRIEHAMKNKGFSREQAIEHIQEMDKTRAHWARTVWGVEVNDPSGFDLVINLDHITIQGATGVIVRALEEEAFQDSDANRSIFEDELITARVWTTLTQSKFTRSARIDITSSNGNVTITGDVGSHKLIGAIVDIAEQTPGVKSVENALSLGASWLW